MTKKTRTKKPARRPAAPSSSVPTSFDAGPMPPTHAARVGVIAEAMVCGTWTRKSSRALAGAWGMTPTTVRRYAAEASALLDLATAQRAKLINLARLRLTEIALENGPDRVAALRTLLEHLGELRQRHLVTPSRDPVSEMTDDELEAFASSGAVPERLQTAGRATD